MIVVLHLACSAFWVDVRLCEINGRWIGSADTPDGPSLGLGLRAVEALEAALAPFEGIVDELLAALPVALAVNVAPGSGGRARPERLDDRLPGVHRVSMGAGPMDGCPYGGKVTLSRMR